jgi:hypothetical protein
VLFEGESRLESCLLRSSAQHARREEFKVTRYTLAVDNNDGIVKRAKCGLEPSAYIPTGREFAESFGGSEYLPYRGSPFSLIRLFEKEDE